MGSPDWEDIKIAMKEVYFCGTWFIPSSALHQFKKKPALKKENATWKITSTYCVHISSVGPSCQTIILSSTTAIKQGKSSLIATSWLHIGSFDTKFHSCYVSTMGFLTLQWFLDLQNTAKFPTSAFKKISGNWVSWNPVSENCISRNWHSENHGSGKCTSGNPICENNISKKNHCFENCSGIHIGQIKVSNLKGWLIFWMGHRRLRI